MTLAVDCGLRACGVALFDGAELARAALVKSPAQRVEGAIAWRAMAEAVEAWAGVTGADLVIETQQFRHQGGAGEMAKVGALFELQGVAGAIIGADWVAGLRGLLPWEWKGSVPKDIMCERIKDRLEPFEWARVTQAGARTHNILDAIGIGLFHLGRLEPRRGC